MDVCLFCSLKSGVNRTKVAAILNAHHFKWSHKISIVTIELLAQKTLLQLLNVTKCCYNVCTTYQQIINSEWRPFCISAVLKVVK